MVCGDLVTHRSSIVMVLNSHRYGASCAMIRPA